MDMCMHLHTQTRTHAIASSTSHKYTDAYTPKCVLAQFLGHAPPEATQELRKKTFEIRLSTTFQKHHDLFSNERKQTSPTMHRSRGVHVVTKSSKWHWGGSHNMKQICSRCCNICTASVVEGGLVPNKCGHVVKDAFNLQRGGQLDPKHVFTVLRCALALLQ